jgi:hypothetical protein
MQTGDASEPVKSNIPTQNTSDRMSALLREFLQPTGRKRQHKMKGRGDRRHAAPDRGDLIFNEGACSMSAMPFADLRPTVVMADSSSLIHLAAVGQLDLLFECGHVVLADVVRLETSLDRSEPFAPEISTWIEANRGSRLSLVDTDLGPVYELAIKSGVRPPRNSGERAIVDWLADNIVHKGGPALIIYENGRIPNMLRREGFPEDVVVMASPYFLRLSQERRREGGLAQDRPARHPLQLAGRSHADSEKHPMDDRLTQRLSRHQRRTDPRQRLPQHRRGGLRCRHPAGRERREGHDRGAHRPGLAPGRRRVTRLSRRA